MATNERDEEPYVSNWNALGPFNTPPTAFSLGNHTGVGQIHKIVFDPGYGLVNTTVYCASGFGGLFKSTDDGDTWQSMTDFAFQFTGVSDLVIDPATGTMFVSTGASDESFRYSTGVWRSANGGQDWENITQDLYFGPDAQFNNIFNLEVVPSDPNIQFIATINGIFKSTNALAVASAVVWEQVLYPLDLNDEPLENYWKGLTFQYGSEQVMFASGKDVYMSTDQGETWASITGALSGLDFSQAPWDPAAPSTDGAATCSRINLASSSSNPDKVSAFVSLGKNGNGSTHAFVLDIPTMLWSYQHMVTNDNSPGSPNSSPSWIALAVSPLGQPNATYYGGRFLNRSLNGLGPTVVGSGILHDDFQELVFSPDGTKLWLGTHGGIYRASDPYSSFQSAQWEALNDQLQVGTIVACSVNPTRSGEAFIGNQDCGTSYRSPDLFGATGSWKHLMGGDGGANIVSPDGSRAWNWLLAPRHYYWRHASPFNVQPASYTFNVVETHPNYMGAFGASEKPPMGFSLGSGRWYMGVSDVWEENDYTVPPSGPGTFTRLTNIQGDLGGTYFTDNCLNQSRTRVVFADSDENYVYHVTGAQLPSVTCPTGHGSRLLRSRRDGNGIIYPEFSTEQQFELTNLPPLFDLNERAITGLVVDPDEPEKLWITFSGYLPSLRIWMSMNEGQSWTNADPDMSLPNLPINDVVYQIGTEDGLYVAMDVGVYYKNASMTSWVPYYGTLPNAQVNDLDINYCDGKIIAGTYGRGLWESDLAEQPNVALQITQNTTWSFHRNLAQDVRVMPGATLTITSTANFAPNTALIIEPGASVVVDGGLLHNSCGLGWNGVQVLGNSGMAQTPANQGYLELRNGGRIEKAAIGILVGDLNDLTQGGGVVKIAGTQAQPGGYVRDCRPAVRFMPYGYTPNSGYYLRNRSKFVHAVFEFTDAAVDAEQGMNELVKLDGVDGIGFYACSFRNIIADVPETQLLGHGIHSMESRFRVTSTCPTPGTPCTAAQMVPSTFSGLDHGVHALGAAASSIFTVENSSFSNNIAGVFASGITGFKVWKNDFELTDRTILFTHPTEEFWGGRPRGIYTYESFGFKIQDNTLHSPTTGTLVAAEAIVVGYSRDHNDKIWKNIARDLSTGFVGEGIAASTEPGGYSGTIGLQILCSSNSNVDKNLYSRKIEGQTDANFHTIRTIQASAGRGADNTLDGWAGETDRWDFYKDTDAPITYYHRTAPNLYPEHVSDDVLVNGIPAASSSECTPNLISTDPNILVNGMLLDGRTQYGETRYLYEQLIDGGNTDAVVEEIESSWPQDVWDLRTYLLSKSPYLSTEALKELVDKYGVPEAIKAEILIANPDATQKDGFLKWAEYDAHYPLPAHLLASIRASWDVKTYRTTLEAQMAAHHARMTEAANELLDIYATRDSSGTHNDSLRWVWQQLPTVAARYAETLLRIQESDYTGAQALMNDLDEDHKLSTAEERERTRMGTLINDLLNLEQQARDVRKLDESEIAAWQTLIDGEYDRPATWISNMLCFHYGICRSPLTGGESEPKTLQRSSPEKPASTERSFKLQPNPASTFVTLNFELLPTENSARLLVQDAQGRIVATENLQGNVGQVVFDTRRWAKGVYTARCMVGEEPAHAEKLVIE